MPNYEVSIDGRPQRIELTRTGPNSLAAKIADKTYNIELQAERPDFEKGFEIKVNDKTYKIEVPLIDGEKAVPVKVEEATFQAQIKDSRTQVVTAFQPTLRTSTGKTLKASKQNAVEGAVTAPMTGKIVAVKVRKGDQVKQNQVLCIIEAMKMENEISATRAGTVQEINVQEGSPVGEGDTLFVIG